MLDVKTSLPDETTTEPKKKCSGCARLPVCQIFRIENEYIQKEFLEKQVKPPFVPDEIATICKYFLPISHVRTTLDLERLPPGKE
jgi:hypothetical protein